MTNTALPGDVVAIARSVARRHGLDWRECLADAFIASRSSKSPVNAASKRTHQLRGNRRVIVNGRPVFRRQEILCLRFPGSVHARRSHQRTTAKTTDTPDPPPLSGRAGDECLLLLARGLTPPQIALSLGIRVRTVNTRLFMARIVIRRRLCA